MKILAVVSDLNLSHHLGTTPAWWGLLKGLHTVGNEVIATSYLGKPIESPWWKTYHNPCSIESEIYNWYLNKTGNREIGSSGTPSNLSKIAIDNWVKPKWEKYLINICEKECPDCVLFVLIPPNHIQGIPTKLSSTFKIPIIAYDGDLPMSLPEYSSEGAFKFSFYDNADISEYDLYLSCSRGCLQRLKELGAKKTDYLYYGVDTSVFRPVTVDSQPYDVFYYGHRARGKEQQMNAMILDAAISMRDRQFLIAGLGFNERPFEGIPNIKMMGHMPLNEWNKYCRLSKINLNITKDIDRHIFGSSSARPFELAAMQTCIVSDEYMGMEEWFTPMEIWQAKEFKDCISMYSMLLQDKDLRDKIAINAYERVCSEHTYNHRARRLMNLIKEL